MADYVAVHMLIEFNGQHMIVLTLVRLGSGLLVDNIGDAVEPSSSKQLRQRILSLSSYPN